VSSSARIPESFARLEAVFKSNAPLVLKGRVNVEEAGTRLAVMEAAASKISVSVPRM